MPRPPSLRATALIIAIVVPQAHPIEVRAQGAPAPRPSALRQAVRAAEDARDSSQAALAPIRQALAGTDTVLQMIAARALGRFERPAFAVTLAPLLASPSAAVRAEAANALAQAAQGIGPRDGEGAQRALDEPIVARLARERDPWVRGVMLHALGRMPNRLEREVTRTERALTEALRVGPGGAADAREVIGVVRGLEALSRTHARTHALGDETIAALRSAARTRRAGSPAAGTSGRDPNGPMRAFEDVPDRLPDPAEIRRLAVAALIPAHRVDGALVVALRADPDPQVRRLVVLAAGADSALEERRSMVVGALVDRVPMVRYEALRVYGRSWMAGDCTPVLPRISDVSPHVVLEAIDLLGGPCSDAHATETLAAIVRELPSRGTTRSADSVPWNVPAHALVALARRDSARARPAIARFASHPTWQVRMYAAHAADALSDLTMLDVLAHDAVPNVREAALTGLIRLRRHGADPALIAALSSTDHQLVLTAATGLAGSPDAARASRALLEALERLTRTRRETSRDPRIAILVRLGELGDPTLAPRLRPLLGDFDPAVADSTAAVLSRWTKTTVSARPRPLTSTPPSAGEAEALRGSRLWLTMAGGGTVVIRLLPDEAPATVLRVARLVRARAYDGRTFHRVVPNFVIQGGSPGANEYAGHDPFLRDEVWLRSHDRGTLGISTRGRDTGDAQMFVNLVDNPRLDFGYTVFAVVEEGMAVIDRVLEGDVIRKVEVVRNTARRKAH